MDAEVLAVLGEIRDCLKSIHGLLEPLALPQRFVLGTDLLSAEDAERLDRDMQQYATGGTTGVPDFRGLTVDRFDEADPKRRDPVLSRQHPTRPVSTGPEA